MLNIFYGKPLHQIHLTYSRKALSICAFCYMWNLFGVVVFHTSIVNWRWGAWYMCILLSVKLFWCSGIPYIYGQLDRGTCALSICAFCYMLNVFGVVVFHRSMVNWRGYICPKYMCILLYVKLIWCSSILYIYGQLDRGTYALSICAFLLCNVKRMTKWMIESNRVKGNCILSYIFSSFVFFMIITNFLWNRIENPLTPINTCSGTATIPLLTSIV